MQWTKCTSAERVQPIVTEICNLFLQQPSRSPPIILTLIVALYLCVITVGANSTLPMWTWISECSRSSWRLWPRGVPSTDNYPGARHYAVRFYDSVGKELWLLGGHGFGNSTETQGLNDLWRYRMNDSTWTWIAGSPTPAHTGVYGVKGTPSASNYPGTRDSAVGWYDRVKEFWVFGGQGYDRDSLGMLNDLWRYQLSDDTWTWISGNDTISQPGEYGTKGVASGSNMIGGRYRAIGFSRVREKSSGCLVVTVMVLPLAVRE